MVIRDRCWMSGESGVEQVRPPHVLAKAQRRVHSTLPPRRRCLRACYPPTSLSSSFSPHSLSPSASTSRALRDNAKHLASASLVQVNRLTACLFFPLDPLLLQTIPKSARSFSPTSLVTALRIVFCSAIRRALSL